MPRTRPGVHRHHLGSWGDTWVESTCKSYQSKLILVSLHHEWREKHGTVRTKVESLQQVLQINAITRCRPSASGRGRCSHIFGIACEHARRGVCRDKWPGEHMEVLIFTTSWRAGSGIRLARSRLLASHKQWRAPTDS